MIVTVTLNPSIDISCRAHHVRPDHKLRCRDVLVQPGGGGINVCRVINELGGKAFAIWTDDGNSGGKLQRLLDEAGVSGRRVSIHGMVRHSLYVAEDTDDSEYRFVLPGPDLTDAELAEVGRHLENLDAVDYLVFSGSVPPGVPAQCYAHLAAKAPGARVVVDTSGPALERTLDTPVFLIKPNLRELSELTDRERLEGDAEVAAAAREAVERYDVTYVLVSLGAGGAQLVSADQAVRLHAPTVKVRSTVGAGDSMVAATVLGFARGWAADEAARYGVAAGTAAATTPGTELCHKEDVERLYEAMKQEAGR